MKFQPGDTLYYVNPFIFSVQKVKIDAIHKEGDELLYIEQTGGYLVERDLFNNLKAARKEALFRLNVFHKNKTEEILYLEPDLVEGDDYGD